MMLTKIKYRFFAMMIHMSLSLIIFIITAILLISVYFPSIHFQINGGIQGLTLMFAIDMILGPLLTFLIFNPNKPKKEKITDITIISIIQLLALSYGFYQVYQQRPLFLLLQPAGVIETVTREHFNGDWKRIDFSQFPTLTKLPLVAFNPNNITINQGIVLPDYYKADLIRVQPEIEKNLNNTQNQQWKNYKNQYKQSIYIVRLVGSYQTEWLLVDGNLQMIGSLERTPTVIENQ